MGIPADPVVHFAKDSPAGKAIVFENEIVTWGELNDRVARAATWLDTHAPVDGPVVIQGWNHPHFIALREAIHRTGRTFAAVSPSAPRAEIDHVLALTGAALFLREPGLGNEPLGLDWKEPFTASPRPTADRRESARTLLLTSGATGRPKACVRPVAADLNRMESMVRTFGLSAGQTHLAAAPLYHSGPAMFQRTHLALGSTLYLESKFRPETVWKQAAEGHANTAFFVPTHYHRLLRHDPGLAVDSIETWWIAGSPAGMHLKESIIARLSAGKLWEFLGSSETGTIAVMPPGGHLAHPGSVGHPPEGVSVRIVDEGGHDLPPGETGLIYVKNGMLMSGYLGADAPEAMWNGGFLSVGDLGSMDADGWLTLADRRTDLIITGGVNVYPAEVEGALLSHPSIREAAVVGLPDDEWGAVVVAVVALQAPVDEVALRAYLADRLAPVKRPKRIVVWDSLPHNAIGKPLRGEVRARLIQERDW